VKRVKSWGKTEMPIKLCQFAVMVSCIHCLLPTATMLTAVMSSGSATPGHARSNDLAGRSTALALPCLLLCFATLVIVWTENKNFTISGCWPLYLFYFDSETISAALAAFVFWGQRLKKGRQLATTSNEVSGYRVMLI